MSQLSGVPLDFPFAIRREFVGRCVVHGDVVIGDVLNLHIHPSYFTIEVPCYSADNRTLGYRDSRVRLRLVDTNSRLAVGVVYAQCKYHRLAFVDDAVAEIGVGCPNGKCEGGELSGLAAEIPYPLPTAIVVRLDWSRDLEVRALYLEIYQSDVLVALRGASIGILSRSHEMHGAPVMRGERTRRCYENRRGLRVELEGLEDYRAVVDSIEGTDLESVVALPCHAAHVEGVVPGAERSIESSDHALIHSAGIGRITGILPCVGERILDLDRVDVAALVPLR